MAEYLIEAVVLALGVIVPVALVFALGCKMEARISETEDEQ